MFCDMTQDLLRVLEELHNVFVVSCKHFIILTLEFCGVVFKYLFVWMKQLYCVFIKTGLIQMWWYVVWWTTHNSETVELD